jgi:hypothetical protein
MKAYAITADTKTTGEILEIEGQIHESTNKVFMVKRDGELNQYYRTWDRLNIFPDGQSQSINGYWFETRQDAISAAKHMIQYEIRARSHAIKLFRSVRFE